MDNPSATTKPSETKALGDYAIRRADKAEKVKSKFYRHMLDKRRRFMYFNPFEQYSRRSKKPNKVNNKIAGNKPDSEKSDLQKLKEVSQEATDTIIKVKSVFPFALFPDTVSIDRHKLTIVYKTFFFTEQTVSVPISNIKNIQADMGPFFGSIIVTSDHFINNTQTVRYLWRKDVKCLQELIQGAMMAQKEDIDITKVGKKQLFKLLTELGSGHSGATA